MIPKLKPFENVSFSKLSILWCGKVRTEAYENGDVT